MDLINNLRDNFKRLFKTRQQLIDNITDKEKQLLTRICKVRGFNKDNLSGFFFIELPHSYLLETPSYIWETWFYHQYIHHQTFLQNSMYPTIFLENVYEDMVKLVNAGYFRLNKGCEMQQVKYLIIDCIEKYEELGVLNRLGENKVEIRYDQVPLFSKIDENIYVQMYFNLILNDMSIDEFLDRDDIPLNIKQAVNMFLNQWSNIKTGYSIGNQYKFTEEQKAYLGFDLLLFSDQNLLDQALKILTNKEKRAIAFYLKKDRYSIFEICELLVRNHDSNNEKDQSGRYKIYPFVEEYIFSSLWLWN